MTVQILYTLQFVQDVDMLSDAQRIQKIKTLVEAGYGHRVVLAHDMHSKHRQVSLQSLTPDVHMQITFTACTYSVFCHVHCVLN